MQKLNELKKVFKDKKIFDQALTHKSWVNENIKERESNERLEFLGDAVLELVVTYHLYNKFRDKNEGYLTALRANIVNTVNLAAIAKKMDLGKSIYLSKGEAVSGRNNDSLLADTVEAVIGAIFIDQGLKVVEKFIENNLLFDLEEKIKNPLKDAKSRLQEMMQAKGNLAPKYKVIKINGPDHARKFTVQVSSANRSDLDRQILGEGDGKSKSEAEQNAASVALERLNV